MNFLLFVALCILFAVSIDAVFFRSRKQGVLPSPTPIVEVQQTEEKNSVPVRIAISRLGIDLPVEEGRYNADQKTWTLSWSAASFANMTVLPNHIAGRTVIYAHNTKKTFGPTSRIQPGDIVTVTTANGARYVYTFTHENVVDPEDTSIFSALEDGSPELVLLTCGGFFNETRRLLHFDFVKMENA